MEIDDVEAPGFCDKGVELGFGQIPDGGSGVLDAVYDCLKIHAVYALGSLLAHILEFVDLVSDRVDVIAGA
jgi:hypothetical protein